MRALPFTLVIAAIVATLLQGQSLTGNVRLNGNMQVNMVDNCTTFLCGDTNTVTGGDANFKAWFASRMEGSIAGRACRAAAVISKTGTPLGSLSIAIYSDNAGQPGTLLFETGTLDESQIISGATNNFPGINWVIPAQALWVAVHVSSPVAFGAPTDYFTIHNHFTGVNTDILYLSDDGSTWVDGGGRSFLSVRFLYAQ